MRFVSLLVLGGLFAAACDSSSTSSSSGGFGYDGGNPQYVTPDGGTTTPPDGGSSPDGATPDGGSGTCTVTLTGALSKTIPCTAAAAFASTDNASGFTITTPALAMGVPEATFALKVTGELQLSQQTYAWMDSVDQAGTIYEGGSSAWEVSQSNAKGSSTVTFTSIGTAFMNGADKVYSVHGTVNAVLVSQDGTASDVAMTVTF